MKNITEDIKKAISIDMLWRFDEFYMFMESANKAGFEFSFWEGEEYWAMMSKDKKTIGYLWQKYPLILISEKNLKQITKIFSEFDYVVRITVKSLDTKELIVDSDPDVVDRLGGFIYDKLISASDLWFSTVT